MKTKEIKLSIGDLEFLIQNLNHSIIRDILLKEKINRQSSDGKYKSRKYSIYFLRRQLEEIANFLTDLFVKKGQLFNSEPNSLGLYIDDLIGMFNPWQFDDF